MANIKDNKLYEEAIIELTSQGKFHIKLGLERINEILKLLDNPQNKLKIVHVAGTNGKGSVCSMLSAVLTASGYKTGLFTSPHIFEYTERIKINDKEIEKDIFGSIIIEIIELADRNAIHLTEFEIITAAAFDYFFKNKTDIVILETGLGGRLDATNVIKENICSIITHIALDHVERLGLTIEEIAYEKSGIIKSNCPVITSSKNSGLEVIKKITQEKNTQIYLEKDASAFLIENLTLKGTYQKENLNLVLQAIQILNKAGYNINDEQIMKGLNNVKHPCRFEVIKEKNIIIDGAHNPNGTKVLRKTLDSEYPNKNFNFIFGCLKNKDYKKMMENLFKANDSIYFYHFDNPNSCTVEELKSSLNKESYDFCEYKNNANPTIICGSFYMIKELLQKMGIK